MLYHETNWASVDEKTKSLIINQLNKIHDSKMKLWREIHTPEHTVMDDMYNWQAMDEQENYVVDFLETIGLPVAYDMPGYYGQYVALDNPTEDFIDEWCREHD